MTGQQFTTILSPVLKLQMTADSTEKKVESMVVNIATLVKNSDETHKEIKTQTGLLTEIRDYLKDIKDTGKKGGGKKGVDLSLKGGIQMGGFLVASAAAIAASSYFFSKIGKVSAPQLATAILISLALVPITQAFINVYQTMRPIQSLGQRAGHFVLDKIGANKRSPISPKSALGMSFMVILGSVLVITAASYILQAVQIPTVSQIATAFLIGIALQPMVIAFGALVIALKKAGIRANKKGIKDLGMTALALTVMVGAIAGIAFALRLLPPQFVEPPEIMWVLKTGFMLWVFSFSFSKVIKATKGMSLKDIAKAALVYPLMALAIIGIATIFSYFGGKFDNSPPLEWSFKTGAALAVFGLGFAILTRSVGRLPLKQILKGVVATAAVALAIVGAAFIFQYLVDEWKSPPIGWTLKTGLALAVFGLAFVLVTKTVGKLPLKDLLMGVVGMAAVAVGILAVAWIFSILPDTFTDIPMGWTLGTVVALIGFGVVVGIIGAIIMATGGAGLAAIALGVVGMIIIAAGILAVAWILSYIPAGKLAEVAKGLTDALLAPVNGIVDVLKRLKEEIGIENLVPLAGGILAVSGSLIALAAAVAGVAVAGLGASLANAASSFVDWVAGNEKEGPMQILEKLVGMHSTVQKTANAMKPLSESFKSLINLATIDNINKLRDMSLAPLLLQNPMYQATGMRMDQYFTKFPKFLNDVAAGYTAIGASQKGINLEVLDKTTNMIKALAYLNEFGGDDAMEKLGKALVDAVQELSDMISKFGGKIEEQTENGNKSSSALSNATSAISNFVSKFTGGGSGGSSSTPQISNADMTEVVDAIEELQRIVKMNKGF